MSEFTAFYQDASRERLQSQCDELEILFTLLKLLEPEPNARTQAHARKAPVIIDVQTRDAEQVSQRKQARSSSTSDLLPVMSRK